MTPFRTPRYEGLPCARCGHRTHNTVEVVYRGTIAIDLPWCNDCRMMLDEAAEQAERDEAAR